MAQPATSRLILAFMRDEEVLHLVAYLTARERYAVDVGVRGTIANCPHHFGELTRSDALRGRADYACRSQRCCTPPYVSLMKLSR